MKNIALALSGGGIRAMVFHLGVLKYMAQQDLLERVSKVSSVSGGSLLTGLLLQSNGLAWPSSKHYLESTYPLLREELCRKSLQWGAARQLLKPANWRFLLSRANLLSLALQSEWGVSSCLSELPQDVEWSINGTTAETGRRFRFKKDNIGDYTLGYASANDFPLSHAIAVSAAFPGGFGPLSIRSDAFEWKKRPKWGAALDTAEPRKPSFGRLHLYDGGVYDNLGLEPFFDVGLQNTKSAGDFIVCSDAGAPLGQGFNKNPLSAFRLKRVADIMSEQSRALRLRPFMNFIRAEVNRGCYIGIADPFHEQAPSPEARRAAEFPTTLKCVSVPDFDVLCAHGEAAAISAFLRYPIGEDIAMRY